MRGQRHAPACHHDDSLLPVVTDDDYDETLGCVRFQEPRDKLDDGDRLAVVSPVGRPPRPTHQYRIGHSSRPQ